MVPLLQDTATLLPHRPRLIDLLHCHNNTHPPATACLPTLRSPLVIVSSQRRFESANDDAGRVHFKTSPFFTIVQPLTGVLECKGLPHSSVRMRAQADQRTARESTRDHVDASVTLSPEIATQLQNDELYRVMVFCAPDSGLNQFSASEVAFPHQVELKVNLDDVKANLRGLKNKPGSTRPADITSFIRKKAGYHNQVTLTYALTQKVCPSSHFVLCRSPKS
jgi:E3 SUMO-protein ligase PIAS1